MGNRIEVITEGSVDSSAEGLISKSPVRVYNIDDNTLTPDEINEITNFLADPIVDIAVANKSVLMRIPEKEEIIQGPYTCIDMSPKPGVNDPEGTTSKKAREEIIGREIGDVSFGMQFFWRGYLNEDEYAGLKKQLGNPVINEFRRFDSGKDSGKFDSYKGIGFHFPYIDLPEVDAFSYISLNLSDDNLVKLSKERLLALNLEELKTIKHLFEESEFIKERAKIGLEAKPTDAEMENLGQTWSEHCIHKKFNAVWQYTSDDPNDEAGLPNITDSIFKSIIKKSTERIAENIDWLVSVFEDNAGVIRLNDRWNSSHKVETHNFPSELDGFGGANTGTGGVIRDPGSTGIGMYPVSSQYWFRMSHPYTYDDLPIKIQSPSRTLETVVAGVEDYGNKFGLPTQCGNVYIDGGWLKPAVYVGCLAVAPSEISGRPTHIKNIEPGYIALSLGGKVGKDGIHGATGSSDSLSSDAEEREEINQAVQIGGPIVEKGVFEVMNILQKLGYIEASQDCGAGGWNSAVGELTGSLNELEKKRYEAQSLFEEKGITQDTPVEERMKAVSEERISSSPILPKKIASPFYDQIKSEIESGRIFGRKSNGKGGVVMDLTHAPEKYAGLTAWEKLISEAQEREVLVIKPENLDRILRICEHNNVEATVIAKFDDTGYYHVKDQNKSINFLPVEFMHQGLPQMEIKAHWKPCENEEPDIDPLDDLTETLLDMVGRPNMQSYGWISTRYDHEVRGGSLVKPLVGIGKGKSDAIAYHPVLGEKEVHIETWGSNPWQGDIDTYHMGRNNVVDAIGRVIALGGRLSDNNGHRIAFNGNTTCPKPEKDPYVAAQVMRMLKGAADAEEAFIAPTISGKDSTSMEREYISTETGKEVHVRAKPELLKSALAVIPDDSTLTTCDFKLPGDIIYIVGDTRDELGASEFYQMCGETGRNVPNSDFGEIKKRYNALSDAIQDGLVHSAQYVSKAGIAAAITNSSIAGDLGVSVNLDSIDDGLGRADKILFSETTGRFVVGVHPSNKEEFEQKMNGCYLRNIGSVGRDNEFDIKYNGKNLVSTTVEYLREKNKGEIRPGKALRAA